MSSLMRRQLCFASIVQQRVSASNNIRGVLMHLVPQSTISRLPYTPYCDNKDRSSSVVSLTISRAVAWCTGKKGWISSYKHSPPKSQHPHRPHNENVDENYPLHHYLIGTVTILVGKYLCPRFLV
ncbi:hypothetical protein P8452_25145 [Trifolium repens]|nr:hypothetical protein P8452_25145 [Trifolium repens]